MTSYSKKGVLRGLHFQTKYSQDKLIHVYCGEVFDVAVDLRKGSSTFGKWEGFCLSGENKLGLYIPSGFAHGYLALSDEVIFSYRCGQPYAPDFDSGIIWNDKELGVKWPLVDIEQLIISPKDQKLQTFAEFKSCSRGFEGIEA
jgi:dTDP-4-dehydrorhamnose 3,5-epimerase